MDKTLIYGLFETTRALAASGYPRIKIFFLKIDLKKIIKIIFYLKTF
jgi:hypothetical protein